MTIRDEIKQNRPFGSAAEEAAVALLRTADVVRRSATAVVEGHGITLQQYNVLRILRGAGEEGLPTLDIADRMIEETPGITRLIDRLETKKLVRRKRCPKDRRRVFCIITTGGLELLSQLDAPIAAANAATLQTLAKDDLEQLLELLDKTRNAYRRTA
jgi:DNA-binding MarR family transcriptional regulator